MISLVMGVSTLYSKNIIDESNNEIFVLEKMKFSIKQQETFLLSFINLNLNSREQIIDAHDVFQTNIQSYLNIQSDSITKSDYQKLQDLESFSFDKQFDETQNDSILNLVKKRDNSFDDFLEKNNAHIIRITEYKKYWGETGVDNLLDDIIINIDSERNFVLYFNPYENDSDQIREKFRTVNDDVVDDLVFILTMQLNSRINSIDENNMELQNIRNSLIAQKEIASKITATTFPAIDKIQESTIGMDVSDESYNLEAVSKTVTFGKSCEKNIQKIEESGISIDGRFDVEKVGNNKNSIQVLISVIKCQQGLRVNAEDYMDAQVQLKDTVENVIFPTHLEMNELIDKIIINQRDNFSNSTLSVGLILSTSLIFTLIVGVYLSNSISKPINKLRNSTKEISQGNLNIKTNISGNDEIAQLARDVDSMAIDLLKQQEELIKSERFSAIGELSARIAHDIRNPLSVIQISLGNIKMAKDKPEIFERSLNRCFKAIERITHQINDVMDFLRNSDLQMDTISLKNFFDSIISELVLLDDVKIITPENDVIIQADKTKLSSLFSNLIMNAVQAVDNKGIITIKISELKDMAKIEIEDSGSGIPEESLEKIFEPLFTTKQEGTGLGLASCKKIVEQHHGTILAKNDPTTFIITLPLGEETTNTK